MRNILPLLLVLLLPGCFWRAPSPSVPPLTPVAVDAAAAYPEQTPGTKPPVLTGFIPLSKEELDKGVIQLFDGVSTFGWFVENDEGELSVIRHNNENVLFCDPSKPEKEIALVHIFGNNRMKFGRSSISNSLSPVFRMLVEGSTVVRDDDGLFSGITVVKVDPENPQPLIEADWRGVAGESEAAWVDGVLELSGGPGMVETVKEYGDFILQLEYFTEPGVNSGVFFRCIPGEILNGYECQIFNNPPDEDYKKYIGTDTGGIFRRCLGRNLGPKDGEWNYLTIAARGNKVATWVNGIQAVDWADTREENENPRNGLRVKPGTIQLQGHDPGTKIKFRNFRISELGE